MALGIGAAVELDMFKNLRFLLILAVMPILLGPACVKAPVVKPVEIIPVVQPTLPKTFGEIKIEEGIGIFLQYKSMHILIDPIGHPVSQMDYVLLTELPKEKDPAPWKANFPPDQKIVGLPKGISFLTNAGFSQVKGLASGQKILLKKEEAFLFLTGVSGKDASGETSGGYLMEFDNGRIVLFLGGLTDEAVLREFLYGLRDDGKEVDVLIINSDDEKKLAARLSLFQPKLGLILADNQGKVAPLKEEIFKTALTDELFSGSYRLVRFGDSIQF